jgi:diguanylate cyclase (GGDEF)-like protein
MDTQSGVFSMAFGAPAAEPVAVTRWTAQLSDSQAEHDYRIQRFADERRRAWLMMGLVSAAGVLNFLVELSAYRHGASSPAALIPTLVPIFLPLLGLGILLQASTPWMLESLMVIFVSIGMVTRLIMLTLHPAMTDMWPTMMVGIVFIVYLYLPIRFVASLALTAAFSIVAPIWWAWSQGTRLPPDQFYRALVWLLLANALAGVAANSLQRTLRSRFAQSLVLRQLLSVDALTGIANRRRFDGALALEWRRCGRAGVPLSLLMIDVDHFKRYNDHWGHQRGDECLRRVAHILLDAVGRPGDLVARYGGEEFVCLLPEIGLAEARAVAARCAAAVEQADIAHPRSPAGRRLTISIGVASVSDFTAAPATLVALADQLLYVAKNAGRDQIAEGELRGAPPVARAA